MQVLFFSFFFEVVCPNQSISICSNIYFRLLFVVKQRLLHSCGVDTSVNTVQPGKYIDVENQSITL